MSILSKESMANVFRCSRTIVLLNEHGVCLHDGAQSLYREFFLMQDKHLSVEHRGTHKVAGEGEPLFGMVQDCVTDLLNYEKCLVRDTTVKIFIIYHLPSGLCCILVGVPVETASASLLLLSLSLILWFLLLLASAIERSSGP